MPLMMVCPLSLSIATCMGAGGRVWVWAGERARELGMFRGWRRRQQGRRTPARGRKRQPSTVPRTPQRRTLNVGSSLVKRLRALEKLELWSLQQRSGGRQGCWG